ncbi:hypothetical protein SSX86_032487 [Deinandra increscens subsp. villosa]|uniref:Uncharacterized protein n=1 Tax=Deinandra increscens subsp. villosa TaxID=3103831 RepID=A0AAP0C811_9ASTR
MAPKSNRKAASKATQLFFAEHNVVAYFEKSDKSKLFDEMNDFLEKSNTHFALTVNPVICKQRIAESFPDPEWSQDDKDRIHIIMTSNRLHQVFIKRKRVTNWEYKKETNMYHIFTSEGETIRSLQDALNGLSKDEIRDIVRIGDTESRIMTRTFHESLLCNKAKFRLQAIEEENKMGTG